MKKILSIGSVNMDYTIYVGDFPLPGETIFGRSRFIQPGGKGENQIIAAAKSNKVETMFIGAVGNDSDGSQIQKILKDYNVKAYLTIFDDTETGNATIVVDNNSENKIVIIGGANMKLSPKEIDENLIKEADYIILQNEISEECNEFAMRKAKEYGKVLVYNPAPFRPLDERLFAFIDYFIPNRIELSKYTKCDDPIMGAKMMLDKGVKNVLVTLGTEGSILINKNEQIKVNACKVKAIDTVAAGDTYVGYFVSSLASGYSLQEAMEYASKASAITVSRKGSVISIPIGEEVYE